MLIGVALNSHIPYTLEECDLVQSTMCTEGQRLSDMHIRLLLEGRPEYQRANPLYASCLRPSRTLISATISSPTALAMEFDVSHG
jgi:hypothetical protein